MDETFIGGKAQNMHIAQRERRTTGTGGTDRTPVKGIVQRDGEVRAMVVPHGKKGTLQEEVEEHVEAGSALTVTICVPMTVWLDGRRIKSQTAL